MFKRFFLFGLVLLLLTTSVFALTYSSWDTPPNLTYDGGGAATTTVAEQYNSTQAGTIGRVIARTSVSVTQKMGIWHDNGSDDLGTLLGYSDTNICTALNYCTFNFSTSIDLNSGQLYWIGATTSGGGAGIKNYSGSSIGTTQQTKMIRLDGTQYLLFLDMNVYSTIDVGITANFGYNVDKQNAELDLNDLTTNNNDNNVVTINDWNWYIDTVSTGEPDQNISFTVTENTDYNVALSVCGTHGGNPYCSYKEETINSGKFFGDTNIYFYDETTEASTSATVDFNGTQYTGTSFYLPSKQITNNSNTNVERTFTITKTGYGTRYYTIDMNQYTDLNIGFLMLADVNGENTEFRFFYPDETTKINTKYIEVRNWGKNNNIVSRLKTDASGDITFFLNLNDNNYHFLIDGGTYDYNSVSVTVNRPRDELTGLDINANWDLTLSGLASASYQNISAVSQLLALYSNTVNYYILTVSSDENVTVYLSRKYEMRPRGNPGTITLQPYLPPSDVGTTIKIITEQDNGVSIIRYPNLTVKIYKNIAGEGRSLIEQTITDAKGEAFVSLIAGDTYEFEVYDSSNNIIQFYGNSVSLLKVAGSQIVFTVNVASGSGGQISVSGINIVFTPIDTGLQVLNSGSRTFTQKIYNIGNDALVINVYYRVNGVLVATDTASSSSNIISLTEDLNYQVLESGDLNVEVRVVWDSNTYYFYKIYYINSAFGGYYNPIEGLRTGLRSDLGCDSTGICASLLALALIVSALLVVIVSLKVGVLGTQATAIMFGIMMTIFTYITWVPIELIIVIWVLIFAFIITDRRGS